MQRVQNPQFLRSVEARLVAARFHPLLEPAADVRVLDVHVLDADRAAIGLAQGGQQLPERCLRRADERAGIERTVEIGRIESELLQLEQRMGRARLAQGIEMGDEMPQVAIGIDQEDDARLPPGIQRRRGQAVDAELEALEEEPPAFIDGSRVLLPLVVGLLDGIQVPARRRRCPIHG